MTRLFLLTFLFWALAIFPVRAQEIPQPVILGYAMDGSYPFEQVPINTLAPVWFSLGKAGELRGTFREEVLQRAKNKNLTVLPVIQGFNGSVIHFMLQDERLRQKLLTELTQIVDHPDIQGINLDFEGVLPQDRYEFTLFVIDLSQICHDRKKLFTLAVPAKVSDNPKNEWSWAFNYAVLGIVSDYLVLMTYDENTSKPGPIGSLPWVKQVLAYAGVTLPKEKIVMGIPFYGRVWATASSQRGVVQSEISELLQKNQPQVEKNQELGVRFSYQRTVDEVGWYEDPDLFKSKLELARMEGLRGVAFWRLGQEDSQVWSSVKEFNSGLLSSSK